MWPLMSAISYGQWEVYKFRLPSDGIINNECSAVAQMGDRLAPIDMGHKEGGGCCAPFGGAGSPSNTIWPGPRSTAMPSFIMIHPTVWPQYTNITDRQEREYRLDRQT